MVHKLPTHPPPHTPPPTHTTNTITIHKAILKGMLIATETKQSSHTHTHTHTQRILQANLCNFFGNFGFLLFLFLFFLSFLSLRLSSSVGLCACPTLCPLSGRWQVGRLLSIPVHPLSCLGIIVILKTHRHHCVRNLPLLTLFYTPGKAMFIYSLDPSCNCLITTWELLQ